LPTIIGSSSQHRNKELRAQIGDPSNGHAQRGHRLAPLENDAQLAARDAGSLGAKSTGSKAGRLDQQRDVRLRARSRRAKSQRSPGVLSREIPRPPRATISAPRRCARDLGALASNTPSLAEAADRAVAALRHVRALGRLRPHRGLLGGGTARRPGQCRCPSPRWLARCNRSSAVAVVLRPRGPLSPPRRSDLTQSAGFNHLHTIDEPRPAEASVCRSTRSRGSRWQQRVKRAHHGGAAP
jgi:hypothetical protein